MVRNYFKMAVRSLLRSKVFSFINIAGLSLGLACCMLILLYTKDEWSFDRFHKNADRLFQLTCHRMGEDKRYATAGMVQGPAFKQAIPGIDAFVRVNPQPFVVKQANMTFNEEGVWTDDNFFTVFSFPLSKGDPGSALADPHSLVLTEETARKYFGDTDAIGKTLELEIDGVFEPFTVSAVAKAAPGNSSIQFRMLLPFKYLQQIHPDNGWMWNAYPTWLLLSPGADTRAIAANMEKVFTIQASSELLEYKQQGYKEKFVWGLQPFVRMHLQPDFEGAPGVSNPVYSYILTGIAFFILAIACINFINLTVAQSMKRRQEIGIRKVIGGRRGQLIGQFLGESFFICSIAFLFAILLAFLALPFFNVLADKKLSLRYLLDGGLTGSFVLLFLVTGLAAGFYPALLLSRLKPVDTLYNRSAVSGKNYLSRGLVVLQFTIATFLIISTLFVYAQFNFLTRSDLGYDDKGLLEMAIDRSVMDRPWTETFKSELASVQGVEKAASRNIGRFSGPTRAGGKEFVAVYEHIDEDYLPALEVPLVAGRNFSKDFPADSAGSVLVNETFAREAGWIDPLGKTVDFMNLPGWGNRKINVIGVVKDYHYESLKQKIQPQVFTLDSRLPWGKFLIRIRPDNIPQTIQSIARVYSKRMPLRPFAYNFKDELNYGNYKAEIKWKQIIGLGAMLTIFISCIGLFGLASLSIQKRTKEIGIRKVLGAGSWRISALLSGNFLFLVLLAFLPAIPLSWYSVHRWLENFAYKIELSWTVFAFAGLLTGMVAFLTVSFHAIRAARMNPARSLRTE